MFEWDSLTRMILDRTSDWTVLGVLLCGSFAREHDDEASDIDVVVAVQEENSAIWAGSWGGRHIEILLMPMTILAGQTPSRATLQGARILFDLDGQMQALTQRLDVLFKSPRPVPDARLAYAQWEIQHGLATLAWMARHADKLAVLDYRDAWASEVMEYLFLSRGIWPPTRRRRAAVLKTGWPGIEQDFEELLASSDPTDIAAAARRLRDRWLPPFHTPPLEEAPILEWPH